MRKLDKTETLVTIDDMAYVRGVTKLTCIVVCVYISSLTQFAYFLSLFELVNLLSKQSNLSRRRFRCYMCLTNALLLRECGLHILPTILLITLAYTDYLYLKIASTFIA